MIFFGISSTYIPLMKIYTFQWNKDCCPNPVLIIGASGSPDTCEVFWSPEVGEPATLPCNGKFLETV